MHDTKDGQLVGHASRTACTYYYIVISICEIIASNESFLCDVRIHRLFRAEETFVGDYVHIQCEVTNRILSQIRASPAISSSFSKTV